MTFFKLNHLATALLAVALLINFNVAQAQSVSEKRAAPRAIGETEKNLSPRALKIEGIKGEPTIPRSQQVPGIGKVFFPGDHFSEAFPGDHFTTRQISALNAQGVRTVEQFLKADAAVIGRLVDTDARTVGQWQRTIYQNMRDNRKKPNRDR